MSIYVLYNFINYIIIIINILNFIITNIVQILHTLKSKLIIMNIETVIKYMNTLISNYLFIIIICLFTFFVCVQKLHTLFLTHKPNMGSYIY